MVDQKVETAKCTGSPEMRMMTKTILMACMADEQLELAVSRDLRLFIRLLLQRGGTRDLSFKLPGGLELRAHVMDHDLVFGLHNPATGIELGYEDLQEVATALSKHSQPTACAYETNGCDDWEYQFPD